MSVTRRYLLETLGTSGVVLALAGCLDSSAATANGTGPDTDTQANTQTAASPSRTATAPADRGRRVPMGQTVTVGNRRMTVANPRVRKAVVTTGMAHTRVVARAGQFVVVDVSVDGGHPDAMPANLELRSVVDGSPVSGGDPLSSLAGEPGAYAFPFPASHHDRAAIRHGAGESRISWTLPADVRETLALEPRFAIQALEVLDRDGQRTLEMTVTNEGERDGTFRARVSLERFSGGSIVSFPVPAGESRTFTGRPGDILTYAVNHGASTLTLQYPTDDGLTSTEQVLQPAPTPTASPT